MNILDDYLLYDINKMHAFNIIVLRESGSEYSVTVAYVIYGMHNT